MGAWRDEETSRAEARRWEPPLSETKVQKCMEGVAELHSNLLLQPPSVGGCLCELCGALWNQIGVPARPGPAVPLLSGCLLGLQGRTFSWHRKVIPFIFSNLDCQLFLIVITMQVLQPMASWSVAAGPDCREPHGEARTACGWQWFQRIVWGLKSVLDVLETDSHSLPLTHSCPPQSVVMNIE